MKLRTKSLNGDKMYVAVLGRFDFSLHQEFRSVLESMPDVQSCEIDLREVPYMDSSALGMLSLAQRHFKELRITGYSREVGDMLRMAGFSTDPDGE